MTTQAEKQETLLRLLEKGMVMVHLDARQPGVKVPSAHRDDAQLRLNLSYRFASRDLTLQGDAIECTLSFASRPFRCKLPLEAIFGVTSHVTGEAMFWPESLPADIKTSAAKNHRPPLVAVPPPTREEEENASSPRARSHLRLIK